MSHTPPTGCHRHQRSPYLPSSGLPRSYTSTLTTRPTFPSPDRVYTHPLPHTHEAFAYHGPSSTFSSPELVPGNASHLNHSFSAEPNKSKRFLATKFYFSSSEYVPSHNHTFFTFTSSNSTLATAFNAATLGLSAPLCRVYFVELMFEETRVEGEEVEAFLKRDLKWTPGEGMMGVDLTLSLEKLHQVDGKQLTFEKVKGNSYSVYLLTISARKGDNPDMTLARVRAEKRYKVLDGVDNVLMLGGRFHNSVWSLFNKN